jgi:RimJ/RimL family protein N-acetyltransferase
VAWTLTGSVDTYLDRAGNFLRSRPADHTVELAAVETLLAQGPAAFGDAPPLFGWWQPPGAPVGAALFHTPPYPALLSGPAATAAPLVAALAEVGWAMSGLTAPVELGTAFAAAWRDATGASPATRRRIRLHRLGTLTPPDPMPPGTARLATGTDLEVLTDWMVAFADETGTRESDLGRYVAARLDYGGLMLWECGGVPVSLAGNNRPAVGVTRIGPVYTPPAHRRRGYAAAITAAVTRAVLDAGAAEAVLFTDLANPTSNALYGRLGYQPVGDRVTLEFSPAATCSPGQCT